MKMFVHDDELAQLEMQAASATERPSVVHQVSIAWHLRQRNTRRAQNIAQELLARLETTQLAWQARLMLVLGEAKWLFAEFEQASQMAQDALQHFSHLQDHSGCCDAHWLISAIAIDQGRQQDSAESLRAAAKSAALAEDRLRAAIVDAAQARWAFFADARASDAEWGERLNFHLAEEEPALAAWTNDFRALQASQASDHANAARYFVAAHEAALATGQIRAAIIDATNMAEDFSKLSDHHSALEQFQRALEIARPTGWPRSIGACLMHTADTMRRLGRLVAAQELLQEALQVMQPLAQARSYAHALQYLGDLALDLGDFPLALKSFQGLEQRADALQHLDFKCVALRGQAHALANLGQGEEAEKVAAKALALTRKQGDAYGHIDSLQVMAEIHARFNLPLQDPCSEASHSLHFLRQAVNLADTISGYLINSQLLDMLAREYAKVGQFEAAYQVAIQANDTRERTHNVQATNRAIAMQISHQTERARAEGEHHRQLAASEAKRSSILQQTSATLEHLSAVGQEITAHLDPNAVYQSLYRHVQGMVMANSFAIYVTTDDGNQLRRCFGIEGEQRLSSHLIAISDQEANCARAARERCEILRDLSDGATHEEG
ncbi:MAG: GGDEF domain-containing protein, partial [Burkholderiales bacterium]|nr:GGDEF domain-containing protein [Burkholderiales bacterium]